MSNTSLLDPKMSSPVQKTALRELIVGTGLQLVFPHLRSSFLQLESLDGALGVTDPLSRRLRIFLLLAPNSVLQLLLHSQRPQQQFHQLLP